MNKTRNLKTKTKTIIVFEEECGYIIPESPELFMKFWQEKFDLVPEQYRHTTKIEFDIDSGCDGYALDVKVSYTRYLTPEEHKRNQKRAQEIAQCKKHSEYNEYLRLRKQFDPEYTCFKKEQK